METVRIRLLWHKQAQFAGYLVAEALGLGESRGVKIVCEGLDFSQKHVAAVLAGATQMAVASPAHVLESADPAALRFILAIQQQSPLVYPVRRSDGIARLADLAGRKVGVWPGHEDLELRWMLHRAGVAADAVERIAMPDTVGPFLASEIASAQMTGYHELHHVEEVLGAAALHLFTAAASDSGILKDGLVVAAAYADAQPQAVQAVVDAVLEGWTIAFTDPGRAVAICAAARPDMSVAEHRRQLADIRALAMTGATLSHGLGYPDESHVARAAAALQAVEGQPVETAGIADVRFWQAAPAALRRADWAGEQPA